MSDLKELTDLKKKVEKLQRESDRAEGALSEIKKQLKKEFDCDSLSAAKKLLITLEKKESKAKAKFTKALESFKEEWKDLLC